MAKDVINRTEGLRRQAQEIICQAYERGYKDGEADAEERDKEQRDELKPCPFCGGHASVVVSGSRYAISCDECYAEGAYASNSKDAAEAWNRRASDGCDD